MPVGVAPIASVQAPARSVDRDRKAFERRFQSSGQNRSDEQTLIVDLIGEYLGKRSRGGISVARVEKLQHQTRLGNGRAYFAVAVGVLARRQVAPDYEGDLRLDLYGRSVRDDAAGRVAAD